MRAGDAAHAARDVEATFDHACEPIGHIGKGPRGGPRHPPDRTLQVFFLDIEQAIVQTMCASHNAEPSSFSTPVFITPRHHRICRARFPF